MSPGSGMCQSRGCRICCDDTLCRVGFFILFCFVFSVYYCLPLCPALFLPFLLAVLLESSSTPLHPGPVPPHPSFLPHTGYPSSSALASTTLLLLPYLLLSAPQETIYALKTAGLGKGSKATCGGIRPGK